jgi:hypothetical protein
MQRHLKMLVANRVLGRFAISSQPADKSCQVYVREPEDEGGDAAAGLLTSTGFAAREALAVLRKHNIATAPLLLRAGLSEHGLARAAGEGNGLSQRVSAIAQCRFLELAAEAMDESAFGLHLAKQIDPRDVGLYFYASSAARDLGEALALFSRYCRIANEAFRLTQRSADTAIEFEFAGLPRYAARHFRREDDEALTKIPSGAARRKRRGDRITARRKAAETIASTT